MYHNGKNVDNEDLPPTSRSTKGHLLRSFFYTYLQHHCLDDFFIPLDPCEFGFEVKESILVPQTNMQKYPNGFIGACNCEKCAKSLCTRRIKEKVIQLLRAISPKLIKLPLYVRVAKKEEVSSFTEISLVSHYYHA